MPRSPPLQCKSLSYSIVLFGRYETIRHSVSPQSAAPIRNLAGFARDRDVCGMRKDRERLEYIVHPRFTRIWDLNPFEISFGFQMSWTTGPDRAAILHSPDPIFSPDPGRPLLPFPPSYCAIVHRRRWAPIALVRSRVLCPRFRDRHKKIRSVDPHGQDPCTNCTYRRDVCNRRRIWKFYIAWERDKEREREREIRTMNVERYLSSFGRACGLKKEPKKFCSWMKAVTCRYCDRKILRLLIFSRLLQQEIPNIVFLDFLFRDFFPKLTNIFMIGFTPTSNIS